MANPFVHVELTTQDPDKQSHFTASCSTGSWRCGDRAWLHLHDGPRRRGHRRRHHEDSRARHPTAWLPYALVEDVTAATAKAKSLGAIVVKDSRKCRTRALSRSLSIRQARRSGSGNEGKVSKTLVVFTSS